MYQAPLLLINTKAVNSVIATEIKRLKAKNAVILGGTSVVSSEAEAELRAMGLKIERLSGQDRYETAVKIANRFKTKYNFTKAFLTTGMEFQYALMAAPFAGDRPILFSAKNSLPAQTRKALVDLGIKEVEIIGGPEVIAEQVVDEISKLGIEVVRIGGNTLEDVNINIVKKYKPDPVKLALARNDLFADALSGAALALKREAPIFLTSPNSVATVLKNYILTLNTTENYIFGGPAAISDSVVTALFTSSGNAPGTPPSSSDPSLPPFAIDPGTLPSVINPGFPSLSQVGNTSSNLNNGGLFAAAGDWAYLGGVRGVYKIKMDGGIVIKVSDDKTKYLNIVGDYIYYLNESAGSTVYKMKTDGTARMQLADTKARFVAVIGDWVYFRGSDDNIFYRVKTDGTSKAAVSPNKVYNVLIEGGWIYYLSAGSDPKVCRMKLDGTSPEELFTHWVSNMSVQGDWIYYTDFNTHKLYKRQISNPSSYTELNGNQVTSINVKDDWIYYSLGPEGKIHKMRTNGTGNTRLNDRESGSLCILGDWIYYLGRGTGVNLEYRKMKLDGTKDQVLYYPS
ncbi:MAG: DUF5050 domain-containing protein [Desulfitobacteriia bacterium]|jgi:putative cell wall-binding protein